MFNSEDFERFFFDYQVKWVQSGMTLLGVL